MAKNVEKFILSFYINHVNFIYILIILMKAIKICSFSFFKTIPTLNNRYYMITPTNIIFYNNFESRPDTKHIFKNDQIIASEEDLEKIYYGRFNEISSAHLLIIKDYVYAISDVGDNYCNKKLDEINGRISCIIPLKIVFPKTYYIIAIINSNNKLDLYLYENDLNVACSAELIFNIEYNFSITSKNLNCYYYEYLICFFENSSNELVASIFNVDINNKNIEYNFSIPKINGGAKIIKSIFSSDLRKFLVCYIKEEKNCDCLTYLLSSNEWVNDPINYLNNCLVKIISFNLQYFDSLNYYILSCFQSEKEFGFVKLNKNFEIYEEENVNYHLSSSLVENCNDLSLASLVNDTDSNIIKIYGICDNNTAKYEIQMVQSNPTTILTTIPRLIPTTILTTIPRLIPTSILTTIPRLVPTTILTTIPRLVPTTILTTVQKLIPTTIITTVQKMALTTILTTIQKMAFTSILTTNADTSNIKVIQEKSYKTLEEIIDNLDTIIKDYDIHQIYEIFGNNYNIKISPINSKIYENISTYIDFSNCENNLRIDNGLNSSSILTVYQIEIDNPNEKSLINNLEYVVYNENRERLNLLACKDDIIEITYQFNISKVNLTKVKYYADMGIDIFNVKDDFFNDICYPYSEGNSDMILKDRISDIYENYSVCEESCEYSNINLTRNTFTCKCNIKKTVDPIVKPPKLKQVIFDSLTDSNLGVIKCYKLVFNFRNKFKNIGFCIFSGLIFIQIAMLIYYCIVGIDSIKKYIFSEMNRFGYWINFKNPLKKQLKKGKYKKNKDDSKRKFNFSAKEILSKGITIKKKYNQRKSVDINPIDLNSVMNLKKEKIKKKQKKNKDGVLLIDYKILNKNYIKIYNGDNIKITNDFKINKSKYNSQLYSLIEIDANNLINKNPIESKIILDNYDYQMAINYDKRNFLRIFYICMLAKGNVVNILLFKTPLDLQPLRIILFIFANSIDLAFNTIFYSNSSISDKYHYEGNSIFLFSLVNNLVQSIVSSVISIITVNLFQHMIESRGSFEDIFKEEEKKMRQNKKYKVSKKTKIEILEQIRKIFSKLKCKIVIFLILDFSIISFFYYFVTAFCEVYKETQISWIYDFFISFLISLATEIVISLLIALFYTLSIRYKLNFIYKMVIFFYNI